MVLSDGESGGSPECTQHGRTHLFGQACEKVSASQELQDQVQLALCLKCCTTEEQGTTLLFSNTKAPLCYFRTPQDRATIRVPLHFFFCYEHFLNIFCIVKESTKNIALNLSSDKNNHSTCSAHKHHQKGHSRHLSHTQQCMNRYPQTVHFSLCFSWQQLTTTTGSLNITNSVCVMFPSSR